MKEERLRPHSGMILHSQIRFDDDLLNENEAQTDKEPLSDELSGSNDSPLIYSTHQTDIAKRLWHQTLWEPVNELEKSALSGSGQGYKVAAYCRVSSEVSVQIRSLENQIRHYTYKIRENPNSKFVGIYFDSNSSGTTMKNRLSLKRLIRHAKEGRVEMILTKNVSRLSRNTKELLEIVDELRTYGVGIYFEAEGIDTATEYNRFLLTTYAALAQGEAEETSNAVKWGYEKNVVKGKPKFMPMLGYEAIEENGIKILRIKEDEAEGVRKIFDWYINGMQLAGIAKRLMSEGIKTFTGSDFWRGNTVKNILTNPAYTGNYVGRRKQRDLLTKQVRKNCTDQLLIENTHPAIISLSDYQKVQELIELRKPPAKDTKHKKPSSLSGRMMCGRCGFTISNYPTRGVNYWKCQPSDLKACAFVSLKENLLREMMAKALLEKYRHESSDEGFLKRIRKELEWVNQNDHFEFYRLKYITEIEMVEKLLDESLETQDVTDVKQYLKYLGANQDLNGHQYLEDIKQAYLDFEKKVIEIEDDRKWRDEALLSLSQVKDEATFLETAGIDVLRAWIRRMKIYSKDDYIVTFIDDSSIEIGSCEAYGEVMLEKVQGSAETWDTADDAGHVSINQHIMSPHITALKPLNLEPMLIELGKEENPLMKNNYANVIKIEPGNNQFLMNDLSRRIHGFESRGIPKTIKADKKLRVAAYCRVSTDREEQEVSLKTQIAYYTYRILKNPKYEFAGIYADDGISGRSTENRPEFLRLIEACREGKVDLILTKSISRFSRNLVDCLSTTQELKVLPSPVFVEFEKENLCTKDEKSDLLISLFAGISQEESVNLGESIAWGRRRFAERGVVNPSRENYGYRHGTKEKWIIDEYEADIVRRIYDESLEGKSYFKIASGLTEDNIITRKGNTRWYGGSIKFILTNPIYAGDVLYQKQYTKDTLTTKVVNNEGELPQYLVENNHPAIIDRETWERVQLEIKRRDGLFKLGMESYPKAQEENIFLKKFKCSQCGALYSPHRRFEKGTGKGPGRSTRKGPVKDTDIGTVTLTETGPDKETVKYEVILWNCYDRISPYSSVKCDSTTITQKYMEFHFMKTLFDIKDNEAFYREVLAFKESLSLSPEELEAEAAINTELDSLNEALYEAVGEEARRRGQDIQLIDSLTESIIKCQEELKVFQARQNQIEKLEAEAKWLTEELAQMDDTILEDPAFLDVFKNNPFRRDIFLRLVESGDVDKAGRITYHFTLGITWTIDFKYDDLKYFMRAYRTEGRNQDKLSLLDGPEVKKLIKFCKEPRSFNEMLAFFNELKFISEAHFRKIILYPLLEREKMKRLYPDEPYRKGRQYYSGKRPVI